MRSYESAVMELDRLLADANAMRRAENLLNCKLQVKRWLIGRVCFEIFGNRPVTSTGLKIDQFAEERGCSVPTIRVPLRVYRVLGNWYERQIEPVKFTIAKLTVQHTQDVADAERLMEKWRKDGETDEAEWKKFLESAANLGTARPTPLPDPDEAEKQLRREARKKFKRFRRRVKAAYEARFFENRFLSPGEATELLRYLGPLMGKRSNLRKILQAVESESGDDGAASENQGEPTIAAPAAELLAACGA